MSPTAPHRNQLWADTLVAELARGGVDHVAVSPGSRSAPLAVAFHRHPRITVSVHPDERSGAFFALGRAKQTGRVVATLTTSGSAVANQHPAVIEAHHALVPLLVLSADRPPHLQAVGANQTIEQAGLFRDHTNWSHTLGLPEPTAKHLRYLRATAGRCLAHARGPPAGPVHLNVPFDEPLAPDPVPGDVPTGLEDQPGGQGREDYLPWLAATNGRRWPEHGLVDAIAKQVTGRPGVIVAGPRHKQDPLPALLVKLAKNLGAPILADPLSGVRHHKEADEHVISTADAFFSANTAREALTPQWILQFGATPTSKHILGYLEQHPQALRVNVDESGRHPDAVATAQISIQADAAATALMIHKRVKNTKGVPKDRWLQRFIELEHAMRRVLDQEGPWEATVPARAIAALAPGGLFFVGSSLPVRDLDRYSAKLQEDRRVIANRGASGIDGTVASASGAAHARGGPAVGVIGDITLSHDQGSLAAMKRHAPGLTLFVMNNGGGAIFGELPIRRHDPPFTELFLTPPEWDLASLARAHGLRHRIIGEAEPLERLIQQDPGGIVEVLVDRERAHERRRLTAQRIKDAAAKTIG